MSESPFGDAFRQQFRAGAPASPDAGDADAVPTDGAGELLDEIADADADAAAVAVEDDLAELARLQAERDEYLDALRRLQADFENYRKRVVREQTALVERATETLVEQLLPVLDSFELALGSLEGSDEKLRKGVELVRTQLRGVLAKAGLQRDRRARRAVRPDRARSRRAGR